jgi:thiamine biosynthesis protein ThiS
MIQITLNGELHYIENHLSVQSFIGTLGVPTSSIAVAINKEVVSKAKLGDVILYEGDKVEIVHPMGGG